jgi:hypothetical protein
MPGNKICWAYLTSYTMKKYFFLFFYFLPSILFAQINISGIIVDNLGNTLSNCTISSVDGRFNTISNEEGEFEFSIGITDKQIIVTHIGFQKEIVSIGNLVELKIILNPQTYSLEELSVGNPALNYLNLAIKKALSDTIQKKYFSGYLRSSSKEDGKIKSFKEIFFDALWNSRGVQYWRPTENRFAVKEDVLYKVESVFNFFGVFVRTGTIINSTIMPNSFQTDKTIYNFKIVKSYKLDSSGDIVEIACNPKSKKEPYFQGIIVVNISTDNILKISGTYFQEKSKGNIAKNQTYKFESNFKEMEGNRLMLNSFILTTKANVKSVRIFEEIILYNNADREVPISNLVNVRKRQVGLINSTYNESFWRKNQVIKYTSNQKEIIDEFNNKKKFISNFLK